MTVTSSEDRRRRAAGADGPEAPMPVVPPAGAATLPPAAGPARPLPRLPRVLGAGETWGFGFTGLLLWLFVVEGAHADLGPAAIGLWVVASAGAVVFNLQVKRMGETWPDVVGGSPNYVTRLYADRPLVARYAGLAYFQAWASVVTLSALLLADLVVQTLQPLGMRPPPGVLRFVFAVVAFVVAFGGSRTLAMVHLFFLVPAVGGLFAFCLHGLGWLALAPDAGAVAGATATGAGAQDWAKWFFVGVYSIYGVDTASTFVAESRKPATTLRCLKFAAWVVPVVYVGGSSWSPAWAGRAAATWRASSSPRRRRCGAGRRRASSPSSWPPPAC